MFNSNFYPTPDDVIQQMLYGIDVTGKIVLEPSGGKGNIVDALKIHGAKEVISCEIHADLKKILQSKCKVIADDFMTVTSDMVSHIDCIIGNPPFNADERHITHAWNIAPAGCEIVMLCNYSSYGNAYSIHRQEFRSIVDQYGSIENLGSCFDNAERSTDVKVGLIRLKKNGEKADEFSGFFMKDDPQEQQENGIMSYNFVRDLVNRYVAACKLFEQQVVLGAEMNALTGAFFGSKLAFTCEKDKAPYLYNDFKKDLQKSAWSWVFDKMNMQKYATKGLKEDINKFVERQTEVPFTMRNIYKMIEVVIGTTSSRMDKAILEVFEKLTHHYHENRWNVEGWKTNSHYLINEKFIMPQISRIGWSGELEIRSYDRYSNYELVEDMTKAICYITGTNYDNIPRLDNFVRDTKPEWGKWFEWAFFEIRCYKKGTCHMKFKDRDVWAILNQNIARIKGYPLPEAINKKS